MTHGGAVPVSVPDPCHCCGAPSTCMLQAGTLRFRLCPECAGTTWKQRHGLWMLCCPMHGPQTPVDVTDVEWFRRIDPRTGARYKSIAAVRTKGGRKVSM